MTYHISELEIEAVSAQPGGRRYAHFLQRVVASHQVWSLRAGDGAWVLAVAPGGRTLVPVWPHPRYAEACAADQWAGAAPATIPLDEWMAEWLPRLRVEGRGVAVFPVPGADGACVEPEALLADLDTELDPL